MGEYILSWVYSLLVCGCITSILLFLTSDEQKKGVIIIGCSCLMVLLLFTPIFEIRTMDFEKLFSQYLVSMKEDVPEFDPDKIMKPLIEMEYEKYILSEANLNNIPIEYITVETIKNEYGDRIPYRVELGGTQQVSASFINYISENLGGIEIIWRGSEVEE